jgi:uncharacterized protein (TIGR00369 family)
MPTLSDTHLRNRYRVQPNDANNHETLHGGNLMKWMDELGAMSAMRFSGETCVTAGVDDLSFHRPVPVGETVLIDGFVYRAGKTSATVHLRAWRENPRTGETQRTTGSSFTFVAIDENGHPVQVPELSVETDEERRLREEALEAEE